MFASTFQGRRALTPFRGLALAAATLAALPLAASAQTAPYTQVIIFGDSLSDDGNVAHLTNSQFGVNYPGGDFNYSDGRFTDSSDTDPSSTNFVGVWHEQLEKRFLGTARATNSLDGGTDYAFGDATTEDSTQDISVGTGLGLNIRIDNMGRQVTNYLNSGPVDAGALFIVWGGGNDLFNDDGPNNVAATASRMGGLVTRLAQAGARNFLVPNVPPLGDVPKFNTDATNGPALNVASANYRDQLNTVLDSTVAALTAQGINITLTRLDVYSLFLDLVANKTSYGFNDVTNSGQGANGQADSYLFWDDVHPTTAGHNQIALAAANILPGGHPAFFGGEANLSGGDFSYLAFPDGQPFGYYSYQFFPYLYSSDLGFEYFMAANDSANGAYLYDFGLQSFLYTSPALYPYLYDFQAGAFYYYFTGTTAPRAFFNFATGAYVYSTN